MADLQLESIVEALGSVSSRKDQLHEAFMGFDGRKSVLAKFTLKWKDLQDHFSDIEKVVNRRVDELRSKEQEFEAKLKKLLEDYAKREEAISQRELVFLSGAANESSVQTMDLGLNVTTTQCGAAKNGSTDKVGSISADFSEVEVNPELKSLCENMDSDGVRNYIANQKKDITSLRAELPSALRLAPNPSRLVLQAINSYPLQDNSRKTSKKDVGAWVTARACLTLLEALAKLLVSQHHNVAFDVKAFAKEAANKWKANMDLKADSSYGGTINAQAFLQLLATFDIASEYSTDEIIDLVVILARRKQTLTLCNFLGLSSKIPDIVDKLCKENRQIDALSFANAFGIMHRLDPVALLKEFLKTAKVSAEDMAKKTKTPASQHNSLVKQLSALKVVLKCIGEYKLEAQYPPTQLQKRVEQLEKLISDKKRGADDLKIQEKRSKVSGTSGIQTSSVLGDRGPRKATGKQDVTNPSPYGLPAQKRYNSSMLSASSKAHTGGIDPLSLSSSYFPSNNALGSELYGISDLAHKGGRDSLLLSGSYLQSRNTPGSQLYRSSGPTHMAGNDLFPLSSAYQPSNTLHSEVYGSTYSGPSTYSSYHFGGGLPPPPPAYQSKFKY